MIKQVFLKQHLIKQQAFFYLDFILLLIVALQLFLYYQCWPTSQEYCIKKAIMKQELGKSENQARICSSIAIRWSAEYYTVALVNIVHCCKFVDVTSVMFTPVLISRWPVLLPPVTWWHYVSLDIHPKTST